MRCLHVFAHHQHPDAELQLHPYTVSCSGFLFEDKSPQQHMQFLSLGSWGSVLYVVLWHQECETNFHKVGGSILSFSIYTSSNLSHSFNPTCKLMTSLEIQTNISIFLLDNLYSNIQEVNWNLVCPNWVYHLAQTHFP